MRACNFFARILGDLGTGGPLAEHDVRMDRKSVQEAFKNLNAQRQKTIQCTIYIENYRLSGVAYRSKAKTQSNASVGKTEILMRNFVSH